MVFLQVGKLFTIAQLLVLVIFVPVSRMRENLRGLKENLKQKIRTLDCKKNISDILSLYDSSSLARLAFLFSKSLLRRPPTLWAELAALVPPMELSRPMSSFSFLQLGWSASLLLPGCTEAAWCPADCWETADFALAETVMLLLDREWPEVSCFNRWGDEVLGSELLEDPKWFEVGCKEGWDGWCPLILLEPTSRLSVWSTSEPPGIEN